MDQTREIEDLKKTVALMQRTLTEHIGGGGEKAHYRGNLYSPGFMYPEDIKNLNQALGGRVKIPDGTDILTLPPGHYAGANLLNSTLNDGDSSILMIDVEALDDTHVQIKELVSYWGYVFYRIVHNKTAGPWSKSNTNVMLFDGYIGDAGTKFTLSDSIARYAYLRILIDNGKDHQMVHEVRAGATIALTDTNAFTSSGIGFDVSKMILSLSGTSGVITNNVAMSVINSTTSAATSTLKLKRIEGII